MKMADLKRDADKVKTALRELNDGAVVATQPLKLYVPVRFRDKQLAFLGNETYVLGLFMLVLEDTYYAVNNINALLRIEPSSVNTVVLDDRDHFEFVFNKGDLVFPNTEPVMTAKLLYYIFDEIVAKGNIPPYVNYLDFGRLFDTARKHAGTKLASTPTVIHMLVSMVARNAKDPSQYFRQVTTGKDLDTVEWVPLRSSTHGATNTTARLMGSHFADNLTSALVDPSDREENIERILRN